MKHSFPTKLAALAYLALALGCGSSSSSTPPSSTDLTVQSISVANGSIWQVNRPIEITFDRAINFGSVFSGSVHILDSNGLQAGGNFSQPLDSTGVLQTNKLLFQPTCPILADGSDAGFAPGGIDYTLTLQGSDAGANAVLPLVGDALAQTITVDFMTPVSTDPHFLYFDSVPGAPSLRIRGQAGVPSSDFDSTYLELAALSSGRAYFQYNAQTSGGVISGAVLTQLGGGLPLNHFSIPENQVGVVFVFNQSVQPAPSNLERVKLEYLDGTWKPIRGRVQLLRNCIGALPYSEVRFKPLGLLPRGATMRLRLEGGFQDLSGNATGFPSGPLALVPNTAASTGTGLTADSFSDRFGSGGLLAGTLEDEDAIFSVPKAVWSGGKLSAVFGTNGQSRARSLWIPLGLGRVNPGGNDVAPVFAFEGTDANGVIETVGNQVGPGALSSAPLLLQGLESTAITIPLAGLVSLGELYVAQPSLLQGFRVDLSQPSQTIPAVTGLTIIRAIASGNSVRLTLTDSCAFSGADCVALDLTRSYNGPTGITATLRPRYFAAYTRFSRDTLPADSRITIQFDATVADAAGNPDPAAALSANGGWHADITDLNGGAWDFVRFEVFFEVDVSGNGWGAFDPLPDLRYIGFSFDQRP